MAFRNRCMQKTAKRTGRQTLDGINLEESNSEIKKEDFPSSTPEADATYNWSNGELKLTWFQMILLWIMSQSSIPDHVAAMPDGNRRFAKTAGIGLPQSYRLGILKFQQMCYLFASIGVRKVTGFIFSTRNFNRSASEIGVILSKITSVAIGTLANLRIPRQLGIMFRFMGQLELLPKEVQVKVAQVEVATSFHKSGLACTMCTAYSCKHETQRMVLDFAKAVGEGVIQSRDITSELIERYLALSVVPEVDLWYRSAGDPRFSDFLVYQSEYAYMHITPKQWPATDGWDWIWALIQFQLHLPFISVVRERHGKLEALEDCAPDSDQTLRQNTFLRRVQAARIAYTEKISNVE